MFSGSSIGLQNLCLEHINYHHRVAYLLACWPHIFHKLELRKSNLDNAATSLNAKLAGCRHLSSLILEHCHVLSSTLEAVLRQLCLLHGQLVLKTVCLNLLSSARHFTRSDARKAGFKPSLNLNCCVLLAQFVTNSSTLTDVTLCHDGVDDVKLRVMIDAASKSGSLTTLDLTGNVIGDESCGDVISALFKARSVRTVYLHENSFSAEGRRLMINSLLDREDLRVSL